MKKIFRFRQLSHLIFIISLFATSGYAQTPLFTFRSPSEVSLTLSEQSKLTKGQQQPGVEETWIVSMTPLETALNGRMLIVNFPGTISSTTFQANFPTSENAGSYNWTGYNLDGSSFRIIKNQEGTLGNAYNAATGKYYGWYDLSPSKFCTFSG